MTANEEKTWYTIAEIAEMYRVSKMTIYRLVSAGRLESIRVGRSFRVSHAALVSYFEKQTTGGNA